MCNIADVIYNAYLIGIYSLFNHLLDSQAGVWQELEAPVVAQEKMSRVDM